MEVEVGCAEETRERVLETVVVDSPSVSETSDVEKVASVGTAPPLLADLVLDAEPVSVLKSDSDPEAVSVPSSLPPPALVEGVLPSVAVSVPEAEPVEVASAVSFPLVTASLEVGPSLSSLPVEVVVFDPFAFPIQAWQAAACFLEAAVQIQVSFVQLYPTSVSLHKVVR